MPVLALTLLVVSSIRTTAIADRMSLGTDILAKSRGSNPNAQKIAPSCNILNLNAACTVVNNPCATCSVLTYDDTRMGGGNVKKMGNGDCGDNILGTCQANLTCVQNPPPNFLGVCQTPPAVVNQ
jgi:hypothetical protein